MKILPWLPVASPLALKSARTPACATLLICYALLTSEAMAQTPSNASGTETIGQAKVTFTTIDVPGSTATNVNGINKSGLMVGSYSSNSVAGGGFTLSDGNFSYFAYPGGDTTEVGSINDSGLIVGYAQIKDQTADVGFTYDGKIFITISQPNKSSTIAEGINNAGDIVGGSGSLSATQAFELITSRYKNVSPPGNFTYDYATSINNNGEIVGWTTGGVNQNNGFARHKDGTFETIAVPGSQMTEAKGVNDSGVVVGWYIGSEIYAFACIHGRYLTIRYPGASATYGLGIGPSGQVVGAYTLNGVTHGFVTTPISFQTPKD